MMKYSGRSASEFIFLRQSGVAANSITMIPLSRPSQANHFASHYVIL
jgi:hypothetical protein